MEISTYECITRDFGSEVVYSRNFNITLLGAAVGGTGTILIDNQREGAIGYLINGMVISTNKNGSFIITINNFLYLQSQFVAPIFLPVVIPFLYYGKNNRVLTIKTTDANAVYTVTYQFLTAGEKLKKKND